MWGTNPYRPKEPAQLYTFNTGVLTSKSLQETKKRAGVHQIQC
jgi:hypothetical protein